MTKDFKDMLYLLKCSIRNDKAILGSDLNYGRIGTLAMQQQVMPLVFNMLEEAHKSGVFKANAEMIEAMKKKVTMAVASSIRGENFLAVVLEKMQEENIKCILLKGALLADLYPVPELRISGDVDLYVDEKEEESAKKILREFGFSVGKRMEGEIDSKCTHKMIKNLELHVSLYEKHCTELWFDYITYDMSKIEPYTTKSGHIYNALEVNEQLMFNILHLIKHFLSSGAGIRQIVDVALYMEKNYDRIDKENYSATMKKLKFDYFMDCCMQIAVMYLGADKNKLLWINDSVSEKDCEKVLDDIEKSGLFGHNDNERRSFNEAYTKALRGIKGVEEGNVSYQKGSLLSRIFLDYDRIKIKYKYVKDKKWLLPVAWIHRAFNVVFGKKNKPLEETLELQEEHLELMRDMKIL